MSARAALEQRFHDLLSGNGGALSRLAASYTNNPSDRDDLFQDIALAIWKALPGFRGESSERTFIFRIAHGVADSPDGTGSGIGGTFAGTYSIDANGRGILTTRPNVGPPLNWTLYVANPSKILLRQAIAGGGQHATIESPMTLTQPATFSMADRGGVSWRSSGTSAANVVAGYASIRPNSGSTM